MSAKRPVENAEWTGMLRRMIRAAGRRFGDNPDELAQLAGLGRELDAQLAVAVHRARDQYGLSWTEIGKLLGISAQGAQQRFGRKAA